MAWDRAAPARCAPLQLHHRPWDTSVGEACLMAIEDHLSRILCAHGIPDGPASEEFTAVLPDATIDAAEGLGRRLCHPLRLTADGTKLIPVTLSVGREAAYASVARPTPCRRTEANGRARVVLSPIVGGGVVATRRDGTEPPRSARAGGASFGFAFPAASSMPSKAGGRATGLLPPSSQPSRTSCGPCQGGRTTASTRRLASRPSGLRLVARGASHPMPSACNCAGATS